MGELVGFAQQLMGDGEIARKTAIDNRNEANAAAAKAQDELDAATSVMDSALAKKTEAQGILAEKTEAESSTRSLMDAALAVQKAAQQKFDEAQDTMETELKRIESEDGDLKNVKTLLQDLMPALIQGSVKSRALLSAEDEKEAAHFTALRDTAQNELTAAIADHDQKQTDHTHALGAKSVATDHLNEFTEEHNIAVAAHDKAVAKKEDADFNAMSKEDIRFSEEARIDNERADFEKVIQLLGTLGEKEGGAEEAAAAAAEGE